MAHAYASTLPSMQSAADARWTPWGGDPAPLAGDSPLIRGANALQAIYAKRVDNLRVAEQAPAHAQAAVIALHQSYLAEIERAASNGEQSSLAPELKEKRDRAEAEAKAADFDLVVEAANTAVESARQDYVAFLSTNHVVLIEEKRAAAHQVVNEYAKVNADAEKKLAAVRERWAILHQSATQICGSLDGRFTRADLPELGAYDKVPLPA